MENNINSTPEMYFPILKWKRGEQQALSALDESIKPYLCPIIETRNFSPEVGSFFSQVELVWRDHWFILDVSNPSGLINSDKEKFLSMAIERNKHTRYEKLIFCVWSTMLEHLDPDILKELLLLPQPVCLRLVTTQSNLETDLQQLENVYEERGLNPKKFILLIDFKENVVKSDDGQNEVKRLIQQEIVCNHYRVVLISGAFPGKVLKETQIPKRTDITSWFKITEDLSYASVDYGDYGCLSPRWEEKKEEKAKEKGSSGIPVPPVIVYTKTASWTAIRSNPGSTPDACRLVLDDDEYRDNQRCCFGCRSMEERANSANPRPGNYETHICEGMVHHFTTVVRRNLELL